MVVLVLFSLANLLVEDWGKKWERFGKVI